MDAVLCVKTEKESDFTMNFATAYISMQRGHKVKRKHWKGYWIVEDGEIVMHCRDGRVINIRESEDMMYTISNMACNDWEIADDYCK